MRGPFSLSFAVFGTSFDSYSSKIPMEKGFSVAETRDLHGEACGLRWWLASPLRAVVMSPRSVDLLAALSL